jgi:hypothetical protein
MAESFIMRPIDPEFWEKVKSRALADRVTLKGLILFMLRIYVKRGLSCFEAIDGKYTRS